MARASTVRLPREIEADPACDAIRARLAPARRLWSGGDATVPLVPLGPALGGALARAWSDAQLVLGLDAAGAALAGEAQGLDALARRTGTSHGARVSRLLLLSGDGAERLYRHAERLAAAHAPRVLVVVVDADAAALGRATLDRPAAVKVVLARHKATVAALLRALAA